MKKEIICPVCHEFFVVNIYGKYLFLYNQKKLNLSCKKCRQKKTKEDFNQQYENALLSKEYYELPDLTGTPGQIRYGEIMRIGIIKRLLSYSNDIYQMKKKIKEKVYAGYWIGLNNLQVKTIYEKIKKDVLTFA